MKKKVSVALIIILLLFINMGLLVAQTATQYWVAPDNKESGPFDMHIVDQMIKTNQITGDTLVWTVGMEDWAAANSIDELKPLFGISTMPVVGTSTAPAVASDTPITTFDTSVVTFDTSVVPPKIPVPPRLTSKYYVVLSGQQTGPYSYQELQEMVQSGQIETTTLAWKEGMPEWTEMQNVTELMPLFITPNESAFSAKQKANNKIYIGTRIGASYNKYASEEKTKNEHGDNLGTIWSLFPAISFSYNFIPLLAVQIEALYTVDEASYKTDTQIEKFDSKSLVIPVLLKVMARPSIFVLGGFVGGYVTFPIEVLSISEVAGESTTIEGDITSIPVGIIAGAEAGIQAGPGDFLIDIRYAQDLMPTKFKASVNNSKDVEQYNASRILLSVGYRFGFLSRAEK